MEHLPVQVIGYILSLLYSAKDAIVASATCKKWLEARHNHLHALYFHYHWLPQLPSHQLEIIIVKIILQTKGLLSLSILLDPGDMLFSDTAVIACIVYTRDTLRNLYIRVATSPSINILEICNRQKLEDLLLSEYSINSVGPIYLKFPALKSLSLTYLSISSLNLSLLLTMCPKLETLSLEGLSIANSDVNATLELSSASLKDIFVDHVFSENFKLGKFILEAPSIEKLWLGNCTLKHFELVTKGSLKFLQLRDVNVLNLDIGENTGNLEVVDVSYIGNPDVSSFTVMWPKLHNMISRSSKLRKLRLWDIVFRNGDEVVNLETVSACFPQLSELSLRYELRDEILHYGMQGSSHLHNVTVLEVGWIVTSQLFLNWVDALLQRCPRLKKLVIYGTFYEVKPNQECPVLSDFTTSIFRLLRKYTCVDVEFKYRACRVQAITD